MHSTLLDILLGACGPHAPRMPSRWLSILSLLLATLCLSTATSNAQASELVPRQVRFSFNLPSTATPDSSVNVDLSVYADQTDGSPLWAERHEIRPGRTGRVTVVLGSQTPGGIPFQLFESNNARWIGVRMNDGSELPRVMLVSVPYALKAADADTIGGLPASAFVLADSSHSSSMRTEETGAVSQSTHSAYVTPNVGEPVIANSLAKWIDATNLGSSGVSEAGGSVGIGLSYGWTPTARLDVNGRVVSRAYGGSSAGLWLAGQDSAAEAFVGSVGTSASDPVGVWHGGGWRMLVTDDGRMSVGPNIRTPNERLDVSGRIYSRAYGGSSAGLWLAGEDTYAEAFVGSVGTNSSDPVGVWHGGGWRMLVTNDGRMSVGLNVRTPGERLDVSGRLLLRGDSAASPGVWIGGNDETTHAFIGSVAPEPLSALGIRHGGQWRLSVASNGYVGIGTSSPTATLDVQGDVKLSGGNLIFADGSSQSTAAAGTGSLPDGAITTNNLGDAAVTEPKLAAGAVTTAKLAAASVDGDRLADSSVGTPKIADAAVTASKVADLAIVSSKVADSAVITSKIADAAVTSAKLAGGSVTTAQLADGSVTAAKLAPGSISGVTLASNDFTGTQTAQVIADGALGFRGVSASSTGTGTGVVGESSGSGGAGVSGMANSATGTAFGVRGVSKASTGTGVYGEASSTTGVTYGVYGVVPSKTGFAIYGRNRATTGPNIAIYGITDGDGGSIAVKGEATKSSGTATLQYGVFGTAAGPSGVGVAGVSTSTFGGTAGVLGQVYSSMGVAGQFVNNASGTANVIVAKALSGNVWRVDTNGNTYAKGTNNVGGADFAEAIQTARDATSYTPGDVIIIDPSADRRVSVCSQPYATNVIGIYATRPGILAAPHDGGLASGEIPVAMIGIVPAKASAENGAIHRGDLLVSSSVPGHVMKGTDRAQMLGAVVGKAMQELERGTGVIEIAVTLQ